MVQWEDPALKACLDTINMNVNFLLLGVSGWEYFHTLNVEYAVIRRRLGFRWPLIPYLVGRLTLLATLLLLTVGQTVAPILLTCQLGITSATVLGNTTLACSSANFMIRAWLIWKNSRLVHILLLLATLGHWVILAIDAANTRAFESNGICLFYMVKVFTGTMIFVYAMFYDLFVFILSIVRLSRQLSKSPFGERLRSQGTFYFAFAVVVNIIPTVFGLLSSVGMLAIGSSLAMTVGAIVSCRAVKSLLDFRASHSDHTPDECVERDTALTTRISITQSSPTAPTNV